MLLAEFAVERSHITDSLVKQFYEIEGVDLFRNYLLLYLIHLLHLTLTSLRFSAFSLLFLLLSVRRDGLAKLFGTFNKPRCYQLRNQLLVTISELGKELSEVNFLFNFFLSGLKSFIVAFKLFFEISTSNFVQ